MRYVYVAIAIGFLLVASFYVGVKLKGAEAQGGICPQARQIFMKSSDDNAHAASCSSSSSFSTPVTWNPAGSRACDAAHANVVIRLTDDGSFGGAHAARPDIPNPGSYTDICYEGLRCGNDPNSPIYGTSVGGSCLYSISGDSNAHVATCNYGTYQNIYCKGGFAAGVPVCGNGVKEGSEECDGSDFGGANCMSLGFSGGPVLCRSAGAPNECTIDTSSCTGGVGCPAPNAQITLPRDADSFDISMNISFQQGAANNSACFKYIWGFGDGSSMINYSAYHQYNIVGQKQIKLRVENMSNPSVYDEDYIDILIVNLSKCDSYYVFADISKPEMWDAFNTSDYIKFLGNSSYMVRVNGCSGNLKCMFGDCPATTGDGSHMIDATGLSALDQPARWMELGFSWDFGDVQYNSYSLAGTNFSKIYGNPGEYRINLFVNKTNDNSLNGSTFVNITILRKPGCFGSNLTYISNTHNEYLTTEPSFAFCKGLDGNLGTPDDCCSAGRTCESSGVCSLNGAIDSCEVECIGLLALAIENNEPTVECTIPVESITCGWNETMGKCATVGKCEDTIIPHGETPSTPGTCTKGYTQSACNNDEYILSWIASFTGTGALAADIGCVDGSKTYSCGKVAQLGFFGVWNALGAIVLIYSFYIITVRKKGVK